MLANCVDEMKNKVAKRERERKKENKNETNLEKEKGRVSHELKRD